MKVPETTSAEALDGYTRGKRIAEGQGPAWKDVQFSVVSLPPKADAFTMPPDLWVRTVYDFVAATHHRRLPVEHVLRTLTPLYLGRTAAWVVQSQPFGAVEVEAEIDALSARFEACKPYLRERWHERK